IVIKSSPVAIGSSVPQWPTFLIPSWRRTSATTSCDVMPSALSTRKTPSRDVANDVTHFLQNLLFYLGKRAFNTRASRKGMSAATEFLTDRAHVNLIALRAHTDPDLPVGQFLKKDCNDHSVNRAEVIDQALVIFRQHAELLCGSETQLKTRDAVVGIETHCAEKLAQQFNASPRIIFVSKLADLSNIHSSSNQLGGDFKSPRRCIRVLKRTGVSGDGDVKICRYIAIDRQI